MPSVDGGDSGFQVPLAKRQKVVPSHAATEVATSNATGSRIFSPFRAIGLVSPTSVPFTSVPLGKTTFQITTSVGLSLQTYDLRRGLALIFVTRPQAPAVITATCAWKDRVFAAWGNTAPGEKGGIWVFKRGKKVTEFDYPAGLSHPVDELLVFGSWVVGCTGRTVEVWKTADGEHYTTLTPPSSARHSERVLTSHVCVLPTYLNKIFVGRLDGGVDIWNVSSGKLLYTVLPAAPDSGAVTAIEPTPVLSLVAIAYSSGALVIHDILRDHPVIMLRPPTTTARPVSTISFRTDGLGAGHDGRRAGVMATAGLDSGDITMWDLNDGGRVTGILRDAHEMPGERRTAGVTKIEFLAGQPVMVSTGTDNSLHTWIFDESPFSPVPRPLHVRRGHSAPVTTLSFLPAASDGSDEVGKWLLSGSKDRSLWGFSLRRDAQNTELSQGNIKHKSTKTAVSGRGADQTTVSSELKTPEITCMASSLNRDGGMGAAAGGKIWANVHGGSAEALSMTGWESIVTGHKGNKFARTWIWGKKKAGRWAFPTHDGTEVKSVAMSPCGSFALVGSAGGAIDMFNLQSGIQRQSFPARLNPLQAKKLRMQQRTANWPLSETDANKYGPGQGKHTNAVTGIMVDSLNTIVVSCGLDGKIKFWDFQSGQLQQELDWHPMCAVTGLRYNSVAGLIALACDDLSIRVIDIETRNIVRELWGCVGQVNDFCISHDGRWVIAASMDSVVRVWDLPTSHLIDAFRLRSSCTALSLSETGEFLATAHADGVGVNIWNNKSLFTVVPTTHIDEDEITEAAAPTASGEGGSAMVDAAFTEEAQKTGSDQIPVISAEQLSQDLMTLSLTPKNKWQTLLNLDAIKQRNKPKEPPKAPPKAPFFLGTTSNLDSLAPANEISSQDAGTKPTAAERSRISKLQDAGNGNGGSAAAAAADLQTSPFTRLLHSSSQSGGDPEPLIEYLKSLSPAKADLEIRSLDPVLRRRDRNEPAAFVAALTARLRSRRDFELVNTWMAVFLRVHADEVAAAAERVRRQAAAGGGGDGDGDDDDGDDEAYVTGSAEMLRQLEEWKKEQARESRRVGEMVSYCRGIVGFLRSPR